jgi:ascorbate-specific PTS system EIIC-type component UlaA
MQKTPINWIKTLKGIIVITPYLMMAVGTYLNNNKLSNNPLYLILFLLIILSIIYAKLTKMKFEIIIGKIILYICLTMFFIWIVKKTH